jgi:hypothetical protein
MNRMGAGGVVIALLGALVASCSSATGPETDLILAGTWSGTLGAGSGGGRALRVTWTIAQNGLQLSGPVTVSTSPAVTPITFDGTITGSLSRTSQLTLSLAARDAASGCAVNGSGAAAGSVLTIDGTLDVTFTSCDGLEVQPPASDHLTLTRDRTAAFSGP